MHASMERERESARESARARETEMGGWLLWMPLQRLGFPSSMIPNAPVCCRKSAHCIRRYESKHYYKCNQPTPPRLVHHSHNHGQYLLSISPPPPPLYGEVKEGKRKKKKEKKKGIPIIEVVIRFCNRPYPPRGSARSIKKNLQYSLAVEIFVSFLCG